MISGFHLLSLKLSTTSLGLRRNGSNSSALHDPSLYSVMVGIDRGLMKAAENLGANPFGFFHVFLPLSLPGVGEDPSSLHLGLGILHYPISFGRSFGRDDLDVD